MAGAVCAGIYIKSAGSVKAAADKPVVTILGGRIATPTHDLGAGHEMPARAIAEALSKHKSIRSGDVILEHAIPRNYAVAEGIRLSPRPNVAVLTGFSGVPGDIHSIGGLPVDKQLSSIKPKRTVHFIPDTAPGLGNPDVRRKWYKLFTAPLASMHAMRKGTDPDTIRFGTQSFGQMAWRAFPEVSPALTDAALKGIRDVYKHKGTAADVYREFAKTLDPAARDYILKGIAEAERAGVAYKPILVTGSSRGDFVAEKSLDALEALKRTKGKGYQVVPILGKNVDVTGRLIAEKGLPAIAGVDQTLYNKLRGLAALNIGSTGASDLNELKALGSPTLLPGDQRALRLREIEKLKGILTPEQLAKLKAVETEFWNAGGIDDIIKTKPHGMRMYNGADDIVNALNDAEFMDAYKNRRRGLSYLRKARSYKRKLADGLVRQAIAMHGGVGGMSGKAKLATGAAAIALLASGATVAALMSRKDKPDEQEVA